MKKWDRHDNVLDESFDMLVRWFTREEKHLPREPFKMSGGVRVDDPERFYRRLRKDVSAGPGSARQRRGALTSDLERLFELFGTEANHE